jgi:CheY-like chemotaxis protein
LLDDGRIALTYRYVACHIKLDHGSSDLVMEPSLRAVSDLSPQHHPSGLNREGSAIILVVERDPHIRELESYFLNEAGFTVNFAADGLDALERARLLRPDIIITEVLVPKLDGLALCRTVKTDPTLQHIVMLVFSILAVQSRAQEAGADAFLMKPLAEKRLVETVRQLLQMRSVLGHTGDEA